MIWKSKIVGHDRVSPDQLLAHPLNFRKHPMPQRQALADAISEIGFIKSITVNKRTGRIVDGHERAWQAMQSEQPFIDVEYVDLSEEDEKKALAVLDAICEMAEPDPELLAQLLAEVETDSEALTKMLADLAEEVGIDTPQPGAPADAGESGYREQYGVIVICSDESEQKEVYERLLADGMNCRVVVT